MNKCGDVIYRKRSLSLLHRFRMWHHQTPSRSVKVSGGATSVLFRAHQYLALDLEMTGFPSDQWQGTLKREVRALRPFNHPDKAGAGHSEEFAVMQNHVEVVEKGLVRWRQLLAKCSAGAPAASLN